jgi:CHASE3 domain sensor protein
MTLGRKISIGFVACVLILLGVAFLSFKNSKKFIASNNMVDHTNQVLSEFEQILISTLDAEAGTRGFIITGDTKFLEDFSDSKSEGVEHLDKVRELTKDNPDQQKNIEELDKEIKMRFDNLNMNIDFRKRNFEEGRESIASGEGKKIEDRIRKIVEKAEGVEKALLLERKQTSNDNASNFNVVSAILFIIIILILVVVYVIVTTNLRALKRAEDETAGKNWLLTGSAELNEKIKGDQSIEELAGNTISFLCTYLKAIIGVVYLFNDKEKSLFLSGQYAFSSPEDIKEKFALNEGLIGQAAREHKQISVTDINEEHIRITSSFLNAKPKNILVTPFLFEGKTVGVIEIGRLTDFNETEIEFINVSLASIAISIKMAQQTQEREKRAAELIIANKELAFQNDEKEKRANELVIINRELARQAGELQTQQEELKQMNEELEEQAQNLKQQQEELQLSNEELE